MYSGTAHFSHNCGTKFFIAYNMFHTKLTKKPDIPNYASFHKLSYGIWVSISQIMSSRSKMQCSTQPFFQLTTVHHEKVTPPPLCNDRTTSAAAIHSYPLPIYHMYTMGASISPHVSVSAHIPLHQQPAPTEFSSMMCDFHPIIIPYRILMGNNTNNPLHTAYINYNGAVIDGITFSRIG